MEDRKDSLTESKVIRQTCSEYVYLRVNAQEADEERKKKKKKDSKIYVNKTDVEQE